MTNYFQDAKTGFHVLTVDNTTVVLSNAQLKLRKTQLSGTLIIGGAPEKIRQNVKGLRGCISSLKINEKMFDLLEEAEQKEAVVQGCSEPKQIDEHFYRKSIARLSAAPPQPARMEADAFSSGTPFDATAHSLRILENAATKSNKKNRPFGKINKRKPGPTVQDRQEMRLTDSSTLTFSGEPSAVYFEYPESERPSTTRDYLVMAFQTTAKSGVLFSVECIADMDYLAIFFEKGLLNMRFNLGSRTHSITSNEQIADGEKHIIKLFRDETNVTLQIDKKPALRYRPKNTGELVLLNMQWRLIIGAATTTRHLEKDQRIKRSTSLYDPFIGSISGLNFNGIMLIDLYNQALRVISNIIIFGWKGREKNASDLENTERGGEENRG
ncbi:hypothetical protein WR25_25913 [Diploscapter pachys]|uniref:Laminin G domain-containing protein n=1 Tax=Diploscapter pachys TaxID=2018661 RepID=A0A2A2LKP4_9BILA|nr:hypothetical protein WR25_25913 [Diploscapter pachys]